MEQLFDLSGGHLALDFVNTVGGMRGVSPKEHLRNYLDLVAFGQQAGVLDQALAGELASAAQRRPEETAAVLAAAIALRESLYRLFSDHIHDQSPRSADLSVLNAALARFLPHRRLGDRGGAFAFEWDRAGELDAMLWPVVEAAASLFASDDLARVRICGLHESHECSWLFIDHTKGGTRRWCSMVSCGNRAKARRHHAKAMGRGGAG